MCKKNIIFALDTGVCKDDVEVVLSESQIKEMEEKINNTITANSHNNEYKYVRFDTSPYAAYVDYNYNISVTNYTQEETNYCGPACVRQSLSFHKNKNSISLTLPSQDTLASKIGTIAKGSASTAMAEALNSYSSTFDFTQSYFAVDILDKTNPSQFFINAMKTMLSTKTTAPIVLLETGSNYGIPQYKGVHIRHYNTISGLTEKVNIQNGDIVSRKLRRVDPHYSSTYKGVYTNDLMEVYEDVKKADESGTNKVLIY